MKVGRHRLSTGAILLRLFSSAPNILLLLRRPVNAFTQQHQQQLSIAAAISSSHNQQFSLRRNHSFFSKISRSSIGMVRQQASKSSSPILLNDLDDPLPDKAPNSVRCVILSDTHGRHDEIPKLPAGDVLMHLGDVADKGSLEHIRSFRSYLERQKEFFSDIVLLEGNHDRNLKDPDQIQLRREYEGIGHFLQDDIVDVAGGRLRVYGASWESCERDKFCFPMDGDDESLSEHADVDMFLTHSTPLHPELGHGWEGSNEITRIVQSHNIPLHLCGHVHWGRGIRTLLGTNTKISLNGANDDSATKNDLSIMVNCCTSWNEPVVLDFDVSSKRVVMVHCPTPSKMQKGMMHLKKRLLCRCTSVR